MHELLTRLATCALLLPALAGAQDEERAAIYDETANAHEQLTEACARAALDNKRVLVMFGGNWCGWCHKLHALFENQAQVRRTLRAEYELVLVDVGHGDKNRDIADKLGADLGQGLPFLTVVGADGQPIANQETGALEEGPRHDPERVLAFLEKCKAPPRDARKVLADALERAGLEERKLFVHLGAPWCGWCHRLEEFLREPEIAAILAKDLIDVKIDQDRMTHGKEVAAELRDGASGGIPWIVVLDADGEPVITSDGPRGNTGYPVKPAEIAHFMTMLETVRADMTEAELETVRRTLEERAEEILEARRKAAEERERRAAEEAAEK